MSTTTKILFQVTERVPKESLMAAYLKKIPLQEFSVSHEDKGKLVSGTISMTIESITVGEREDVMNFTGTIMKMFGAELAVRFIKIRFLGLSCAGHVSSQVAEGQIKIDAGI